MPKINYQDLEKKLKFDKKNCWEIWDEAEKKKVFAFNEKYKSFLNDAKTEREAVRAGVKIAEKNGFKNLADCKSLKTGDKVYAVNHDKNLALAVVGKKPLSAGFKMIMSHIDSPRLDLKIKPLYEDESLAFFKTHYYGGIKKYHWPTIPLSLHGVVVLASGKRVDIKIGDEENDPIFMITDLLPHLAKAQMKKTLNEAIMGEELNILVGSIPVKDDKVKEKVKLAVLEYLNNKYGIIEEDFFSAEIQAVPASKARDIGFDRSLIASYGQDDRVCAFPSLSALMEAAPDEQTQICFWVDREEIGSEGITGAQSIFLESFVVHLLEKLKQPAQLKDVYQIFNNSRALSSDVTAALDPDYKEVHDPRNCAKMGCGVAFEKYTGHRGKSSTSEASAEYVQAIRKLMNDNKVIWQTSNLGKVDEGGGGTIAMYMARRGIEIIDIGVPLFNMHAPWEIASKADIYCAFLAYKVFYK